MLFVVIQLSPRTKFNPFIQRNDLFDLFAETKAIGKKSHTHHLTYHKDESAAQNHMGHMDQLTAKINRFVLLQMLVDNHYRIPTRRPLFGQATQNADFIFGGLRRPLEQRPQIEQRPQRLLVQRPLVQMPQPEVRRNNTPSIPARTTPVTASTPFEQIPRPNAVQQAKAAEVAKKLGDQLPQECCDPISMEPLTDPIEINNRVYNRETIPNLVKKGEFADPFTRERIKLEKAKPAHYMLDAIIQHTDAVAKKEPSMLAAHRGTEVRPLKDLIEVWEKLLSSSPSASAALI